MVERSMAMAEPVSVRHRPFFPVRAETGRVRRVT
jgi:hypothetical protein